MTNWPVKTLGELFEFKNGRGFKKTEWSTSGLPIIRIQNLNSDSAPYNYFTGTFDEGILVEGGDLLFSWSGSIGTSFGPHVWRRSSGLLNQHIFKVVPKVPMNTDYAHYCLRVITAEIERSVNGAVGLVHITKEKLNKFEIPVPPLEEQNRIVAFLDAATARVTELTACYEQARTHAELLAGSLLVEFLTGVVDSETMKLGNIAELKGRIGWRGLTAKEYTKEGPLFVSVHSLNYGHYVNLQDAFHISQERYDESPEIMLREHDILICKDGAGIGKLGIVGRLPGSATINSSLLLIRASEKVRSEFLYFYLMSPIFQNLVQERLSGSTTPHLYQRDIADLEIKLPSLETQDGLIYRMWNALGRQSGLVDCFNNQIKATLQMRQSILEAAFAGDL